LNWRRCSKRTTGWDTRERAASHRFVEVLPFDFRLKRGHKELEVYVMCEFPSSAILADKFAERFDGFS